MENWAAYKKMCTDLKDDDQKYFLNKIITKNPSKIDFGKILWTVFEENSGQTNEQMDMGGPMNLLHLGIWNVHKGIHWKTETETYKAGISRHF